MFRIDKENKEAPLAEVTFEKGTLAGHTFRGELAPCRNLTCECDKIYTRLEDGEQVYDLWLNTDTQKAEATGEEEPVQSFAADLTAEISPDDWDYLHQLYYVFKLAGTEMADPAEIEVVFDENEVEEGVMANYNELLPYGLQLVCTLGDVDYEVDTLYCVRPNCGCTAMNLTFHAQKEGEYVADTESPVVSYDYATGKHAVENRGRNTFHAPNDLLTELKARVPALDKMLKERHQRFKTIYKSYLRRKGILSKSNRAMERPVLAVPQPRLAGRNEPCPCGSGKKYKKCCGA